MDGKVTINKFQKDLEENPEVFHDFQQNFKGKIFDVINSY
jgi:hypothetical protein